MSNDNAENSVPGVPNPAGPARVSIPDQIDDLPINALANAPALDQAAIAAQRYDALPLDLVQDIDQLTRQLINGISGQETATSYDAWINAWLEPYGLAQRTAWNQQDRSITTRITTLEAAHGMGRSNTDTDPDSAG